jgi:hypothetical protein
MTAPILKLSQLTAATALTGTEALPVVQGGVTKKTTAAELIPIPVTKFVFDTSNNTVPGDGEMAWNQTDMTVDVGLPGGVTLQVGQETLMRVRASAAITNGQCVMVTGTHGNTGRIEAAPANGDGSVNAMFIVGVATQNIELNSEGFVTTFGQIRSLDTDGSVVGETWLDGDVLYPHPTILGGLTKGSHVLELPIAFVLRANNNGSLFVRR